MGISETNNHTKIKIKMLNPNQEPPEFAKTPNDDLNDMNVLCTFKIKIESQNLDHGCIKDQWPCPNQDQEPNSQSGTSSVLQSPELELKGHGKSWHLQTQDREQKCRSWVYQRPVNISKSRSRCQTPVRDIKYPQKPKIRTWRTWMFFALSKSI